MDDFEALCDLLERHYKQDVPDLEGLIFDPEYRVLQCTGFCCNLCEVFHDSHGRTWALSGEHLN